MTASWDKLFGYDCANHDGGLIQLLSTGRTMYKLVVLWTLGSLVQAYVT